MRSRKNNSYQKIESAWKQNQRAIGIESELAKELLPGSRSNSAFPEIDTMPCVNAGQLRDLIIELSNQRSIGRFYLRGYRVTGRFSLEGLSGPNGQPLRPITFVQCLFEEGICCSLAKMTSLSLRGSRFGVNREETTTDFNKKLLHINLSKSTYEGDLDLSHIKPFASKTNESCVAFLHDALESDQENFRIDDNHLIKGANSLVADLGGSSVHGEFLAEQSMFVEDDIFVTDNSLSIYSHCALNISNCHFHKNVVLSPGLEVVGGLKAKNIVCHSEVWLRDAHLFGGYLRFKNSNKSEGYERPAALNLQSATFKSSLFISQKAHSTKINGSLFLASVNVEICFAEDLDFSPAFSISTESSIFGQFIRAKELIISEFDGDNNFHASVGNSDGESTLAYVCLKRLISDKATISLKKAKLLNLPSIASLDFSESKVGRLVVKVNEFEKADFFGLKADFFRLNTYRKGHSLVFSRSEITTETKIKGMVANLDFSRSAHGNLNIEQWTTPVPERSDLQQLIWPKLSLERTNVRGSIDVGRSFAPIQKEALKYKLNFFGGRVNAHLLMIAVEEQKTSQWRKREHFNVPFRQGILSAIEFENGKYTTNLSGYSEAFHRLSNEHSIQIDSAEKAIEYLCVFCGYLTAELEQEGSNKTLSQFRIVTQTELLYLAKWKNKNYIPEGVSDCRIVDSEAGGKTENNEVFPLKLPSKLVAFGSMKEMINYYQKHDFQLPIIKNYSIIRFAMSEWLTEVAKKVNERYIQKKASQVFGDTKKENDNSEHELKSFFIPAFYIFHEKLYLGVFYLEKNKPTIEMIDDIPVCYLTKKGNRRAEIISGKEMFDVANREDDSDNNEPYLLLDLPDYGESISRGKGRACIVEFDKGNNELSEILHGYLPASLNLTKTKVENNLVERIWGIDRFALVNLSDCTCGLLADGSGQGWGDFVFFKTDRFKPQMLRRYTEHEDGFRHEKSIGSRITTFFDRLNDPLSFKKILKHVDASPDEIYLKGYSNKTGFQNTGFGFQEKRLLWLSHYHNNLNDSSVAAKEIDVTSFRRVAKNYQTLGLHKASDYIEEARIFREHEEKCRSYENSNSKPLTGILWVLSTIWMFLLLNEGSGDTGIKLAAIGFVSGLILFVFAFIKFFKKLIMKSGAVVMRVSFRYGLSRSRPIFTILAFILLGWWGGNKLDEHGFLIIESSAVAAYTHDYQSPNEQASLSFVKGDSNAKILVKSSNVRCGSTVNYGVFAIDTFIPLIELDQAERCMIRPFDTEAPRQDIPYWSMFDKNALKNDCVKQSLRLCKISNAWNIVIQHPSTWRFIHTIYIILGWIVVSYTILIYSNSLKRSNKQEI